MEATKDIKLTESQVKSIQKFVGQMNDISKAYKTTEVAMNNYLVSIMDANGIDSKVDYSVDLDIDNNILKLIKVDGNS